MAERVKVLLTEEEVDARIQAIGESDQQGLRGQAGASCLCFKGRELFYVRARKEDPRAGIP